MESRKVKSKRKLNVKKVIGAVAVVAGLLLGTGEVVHTLLPTPKVEAKVPTVKYEYTITDTDANGYYIGKNDSYKKYPGIAFTQHQIKSGEHFNVGDNVKVSFDKRNPDEGIVNVEKSTHHVSKVKNYLVWSYKIKSIKGNEIYAVNPNDVDFPDVTFYKSDSKDKLKVGDWVVTVFTDDTLVQVMKVGN